MTQWNGSTLGKPTLGKPTLGKPTLGKPTLAKMRVDHEGAGEGSGPVAPRYDMIELMFFAYRDFVEDADRILARDGFGRAHHRVLYFATRRPGLTIAELLDILRITKQSLNRVLKALLDRGFVSMRLGETDRRQRLLYATARGAALIEKIAAVQSARFTRAFAQLGPGAAEQAAAFLASMTGSMAEPGEAGDGPIPVLPLAAMRELEAHTPEVSSERS